MHEGKDLPDIPRPEEPELPCHDTGQRHPYDPADFTQALPDDIPGAEVLRGRQEETGGNVPGPFADDHIERVAPASRHRDGFTAFFCNRDEGLCDYQGLRSDGSG